MKNKDVLNKISNDAYNKKLWRNEGQYCNTKTHPIIFQYRRYKRGKNRCNYCGAKLGKIKCKRLSNSEMLGDNIFTSSSIMEILKKKGSIKNEE